MQWGTVEEVFWGSYPLTFDLGLFLWLHALTPADPDRLDKEEREVSTGAE